MINIGGFIYIDFNYGIDNKYLFYVVIVIDNLIIGIILFRVYNIKEFEYLINYFINNLGYILSEIKIVFLFKLIKNVFFRLFFVENMGNLMVGFVFN